MTNKKKVDKAITRVNSDIMPRDELVIRARMAWALAAAKARAVAKELLDQVRLLWGMLTDSSFVMKWESKGAIVAALIYFISPVDAIPDVIPGVGYVDDAVVIGWVLHKISEEVARYRKHRKAA